jgi:hypothetical protein
LKKNSRKSSPSLDGIENELRVVQYFQGTNAASSWWQRNFAHKYPDYIYDTVEERIKERVEQTRN